MGKKPKVSRMSKQKFIKTSPASILLMKNDELRPLVRRMRELYTKQADILNKYSSTIYSHSLDLIQEYYEEYPQTAVSRMKQNDMRRELFRLQDFFQSQSSTVKGSKEIQKEQDIRIFGEDLLGRPKKRMTLQQRKDFWAAYNEFKNSMKADAFARLGSNRVQQFLGAMKMESKERKGSPFTAFDLVELRKRLEEDRKYNEWEKNDYERSSNVHSGKRDY